MNTRTVATHRAPSVHLAGPLAAALHHALARLRALRQRRALAAELSGLSDRELADIGMTRSMAPAPTLGLPYALYR